MNLRKMVEAYLPKRILLKAKHSIPPSFQWRIKRWIASKTGFYVSWKGICPICEKSTTFSAANRILKEYCVCQKCGASARERALFAILNEKFPNWRTLKIHESSPGNMALSNKIKAECQNYTASQFWPDKELGTLIDGFRNENLEALTFPDESFDLFITQDVMEHVYHPEQAFASIAKVLKANGAHLFTVPIDNKEKPSETWATLGENGDPVFLKEEEWHGTPIAGRSAVTMHYGYDILEMIEKNGGMKTERIETPIGLGQESVNVFLSVKGENTI
jgi:SAM-dependent methyltransferase